MRLHATNPQLRLVEQVVAIINQGKVIVYPTDSGYALGCQIGDKEAIERIRCIRQLSKSHNFTLLCRDLSEISVYARIDNPIFRYLKAHTPAPYTFILLASKEVPRRLQHPRKKTIGIRVPQNVIVSSILQTLGSPLMSVSLALASDEYSFDIEEIVTKLGKQVDLIVDGGFCQLNPTTIVDLTTGEPIIVREGQGDVSDM